MSSDLEESFDYEEAGIQERIMKELYNIEEEFQENFTVLSRKMRIYIFCLFLILSVVVDLESGIFNSSIDYLQKDLNMNNTEYGLFVSISFTGRIIGLVIFMFVLNFKHRKYILVLTIFLHGASYSLYQISSNSYLLTFAKMFAAGNKVCASIYRPVWIEQFGLSKYKSIFFSLVQIMSSYGQMIGFTLGSFLFKSDWRKGLLSILVIMFIIGIGFLIVPVKYFFRSYMYYEDKLVDIEDDENNNNYISSSNNEEDNVKNSDDSNQRKQSIFIDTKTMNKKKIEKSLGYNKETLLNKIKKILIDILSLIKSKLYILCMINRANVTFILQIVHSYLKQHQQHSINEPNEDLIVLFYSIASLGATALGGFIGGVITKQLGGYESKKSIYIVIIPEIITTIAISFLAFTKNFYIYNVNLIIFFCFITMGAPVIQGYLIKTIPKSIKGIGVGLDMIVSTFLGKIPGPIIYGAIKDKYGNENNSLAWQICICYFYLGAIIAFILCFFKVKEGHVSKDSVVIKMEDNVINIASISAGTDANDFFRMSTPIPKRKTSVRYELKDINIKNKYSNKNALPSIMEDDESERFSENGGNSERNFSTIL